MVTGWIHSLLRPLRRKIPESWGQEEPPVHTSSKTAPRIAYSQSDDSYLVVWGDNRNEPTGNAYDVYAQLVNADCSLSGGNISVSSGPGGQIDPDIALDPGNGLTLVVWQDDRHETTTGDDIYGQILTTAAQPHGGEIVITNTTGNQTSPRVAYAGEDIFFVTCLDRSFSPYTLRG